jgi:hypothetical protein
MHSSIKTSYRVTQTKLHYIAFAAKPESVHLTQIYTHIQEYYTICIARKIPLRLKLFLQLLCAAGRGMNALFAEIAMRLLKLEKLLAPSRVRQV